MTIRPPCAKPSSDRTGTSTASASSQGAMRSKPGFSRSQKYKPMQPWIQATTRTVTCIRPRIGEAIQKA
ncbi:hypothetical protein [Methylobacterium oryzae]|uniref:hypothetical protein n=1 Tax=Methylobacterium oryzae TaxID=334852 RepID=UPI002F3560E3